MVRVSYPQILDSYPQFEGFFILDTKKPKLMGFLVYGVIIYLSV
jgi:hypothetical protein